MSNYDDRTGAFDAARQIAAAITPNSRSAYDLPPPSSAPHQTRSESTGRLPKSPSSIKASGATATESSPHANAVVKSVGFADHSAASGNNLDPESSAPPPATRRKSSVIQSTFVKFKTRRLSQSSTASTSSTTPSSLAKRRRFTIKFRTAIVGLIVCLACLVAPLSWHFTYKEAVSTSYSFGLEFQSALIEDAIESIQVHLLAATGLATLQQLHWQRGIYSFGNKQQAMQSMFLSLKEHADLLSSMVFTTASSGELWGYFTTKNATNPPEHLFYRWETQGGTFTEYAIDPQDQVMQVGTRQPSFDVSRWQQSAWVSVFHPFFDSSNRFLGVTSSGFDLPKISTILASIAAKARRPASIYAFDARSGSILGTSTGSLDLYVHDKDSKIIVRPFTFDELATSGQDPFLSSAFRHLQSIAASNAGQVNLTLITTRSTMVIPSVIGPPTTWLVGVKPLVWGSDKSLQWIVFVAMNEDEVMLPNRQASRQLLLTVVGITAAGCLLALGISQSFVGTLADVTNKLQKASKKSLMTIDAASADVPSRRNRYHIDIAESILISQAYTTMMTAFTTAAADSAALAHKSSMLNRSTGSSAAGQHRLSGSRVGAGVEHDADKGSGVAASLTRVSTTVPTRSHSLLPPGPRGETAEHHSRSLPRATARSPERFHGDSAK